MSDRCEDLHASNGECERALTNGLRPDDNTKTINPAKNGSLEASQATVEAGPRRPKQASRSVPSKHKPEVNAQGEKNAQDQSQASAQSFDVDEGIRSLRKVRLHSIEEISKIEVIEPKWLVPGVLFEGFTLLAGPEEVGKSFLALNTLLALARQEPGAGFIYLALDDPWKRIKPRLSKLLAAEPFVSEPPLRNVRFVSQADNWPRMKGKQGDGLADLIAELKEMPDPRLVVIDTLSLFLPEAKGNVTYAQEYDQMTEIRKVIGMFPHLSILAITHINKGENSDQFEAMYGTRGKGAGSDVQMLMIREAGQNRASLKIRGNDLADCISTLTWLPGELRWEVNDTTAAGEEGYDEAASRCKEVAQVQANRTNERKRSGPKPVKGEQARADAIALLKDGPMLSRDFKKAMKDKGHSDDAFRKAQEHLGFRVIDGHYRLPPL